MKSKLITKQRLFLGGLLVILVATSFLYIPVNASGDEDDEDGIDDDYEHENERDVDVEYSPYEVQISSSISNNGIENEFQIQVKVGSDGLRLELEYEEDNETIETEIDFDVSFTEIIEFTDLSGEGAYNDTDDVEQTLTLENFKPIDYSVETIDNTSVHVLFVETEDEVFSSTLYISSEFVNVSGVIVAPTQMKIDIGIHNFNYTELDTQLALQVELDSESEVDYEEDEDTEDEEFGHADDEYEININLDDYSGFFSWAEVVLVDDVEHNVTITPFESGSEDHIMFINYPRGTEIIHDPKIGIEGILTEIDYTNPDTFLIPWVQLLNPTQIELLIVSAISFLILTSLVLVFRKQKVA
ncbi:MAG: hypothetical protein GOP50_07625 [Candidatus Heimdallarchaeota archaeon]|nr:hypothetical protein [Candidatus Heimdallarchaeota archaeon]